MKKLNDTTKQNIKRVLIVLLSFGVIVGVGFMDPDIQSVDEILKQVEPWWIAGACVCSLLYYFGDAAMFYLAIKQTPHPQKMGESILTTMVGFFYSALTPFQSGGQPMQVVQLMGRGVPVGTSTSVMLIKFIAWQVSITLLATAGLVFFGAAGFADSVGGMVLLVFGYAANAALMLGAILLLIRPEFVYKIGAGLLNWLSKIRLLKLADRVEKLKEKWAKTVEDFRVATGFIANNLKCMIEVWLISMVEALAYMAVTYCIYRAFGLSMHSFIYVALLQSMLFVAVSFIPLPGASIASEGGFYMVFNELFSAGTTFPAMLLWRVFTYYSSLILGLIAVIISGMRGNKAKARDSECI